MPATMDPTTAAIAVRASRFSASGSVSMDVAPDDGRPLLTLERAMSDSLTVRLPRAPVVPPLAALPKRLTPVMLLAAEAPLLAASGCARAPAAESADFLRRDEGSKTGASGDSALPGCRRQLPASTLWRRPLAPLPPLGRHHSVLSATLRRGCSHAPQTSAQGPMPILKSLQI